MPGDRQISLADSNYDDDNDTVGLLLCFGPMRVHAIIEKEVNFEEIIQDYHLPWLSLCLSHFFVAFSMSHTLNSSRLHAENKQTRTIFFSLVFVRMKRCFS